jgi:hypothetical protein
MKGFNMKNFKGIMIALYVFIILGSVQNYSNQYNGQEVFSLIGILDNFVITAILPLIIYGVGRKFFFKKPDTAPVSTPENSSLPTPEISELKKPIRVWQVILPIMLGILLISILYNLFVPRSSEGDKYFEIEQSISAVVKDWNVAATPVSEAIRGLSDGSIGTAEARGIVGEASSKFAVITNRLDDTCMSIPSYDVNASGQEGAFAKSYDALQVTCDLLPQESTELLLLVSEQISPVGTQAKIDYHANQISIIVEKRRKAVLDSLDAMTPYLSEAQKANVERMRTVLTG